MLHTLRQCVVGLKTLQLEWVFLTYHGRTGLRPQTSVYFGERCGNGIQEPILTLHLLYNMV